MDPLSLDGSMQLGEKKLLQFTVVEAKPHFVAWPENCQVKRKFLRQQPRFLNLTTYPVLLIQNLRGC